MKIDVKKGFTLLETLIVVLIVTVMLTGGYLVLSTGQATWFTTDTNIRLQENLRQSLEKVIMELRQSSVSQTQLFDGTGANNTDVIRFSVPIVCQAGERLIDINGDVQHWGAPLTWGCTDSTCMDADNDCSVINYKYIEYRINNENQLIRKVLDEALTVVRTDVFAHNISDFQITSGFGRVNLSVTVLKTTAMNRVLSAQTNEEVYLRN